MEKELNIANINLSNHLGTPLTHAAETGNTELVLKLLDMGAKIDHPDHLKNTPLFLAAQNGHLDVVRILLDRGAVVDLSVGGVVDTPLLVAADKGHLEVVRLLLDKGAAVDQRSKYGKNPLISALLHDHAEVVELLLDRGADHSMTFTNTTPLVVAASSSRTDMMQILLNKGANIDAPNDFGFTPLITAAGQGDLGAVKLLIESGANIHAAGDYCNGAKAVCVAATNYYYDVVELLIANGAIDDSTASDVLSSCFMGDRMDICELVLQACPQTARRRTDGFSYVFLSAKSDHPKSYAVLQLLVENGASLEFVNYEEEEPQTALHVAVKNGHADKVWLLMLNGACEIPFFKEESDASSLWRFCEELVDCKTLQQTHTALIHFWTPQTHKLHPVWVRQAIICVLLVAKKQAWPFDRLLLVKILSYVAYGWYWPPTC